MGGGLIYNTRLVNLTDFTVMIVWACLIYLGSVNGEQVASRLEMQNPAVYAYIHAVRLLLVLLFAKKKTNLLTLSSK